MPRFEFQRALEGLPRWFELSLLELPESGLEKRCGSTGSSVRHLVRNYRGGDTRPMIG
jgi:hypothetical protein